MSSRRTNLASFAALAATTLVVAACGGKSSNDMQPPPATNTAPVIAAIADRTSSQDTVVGPIEFAISDAETTANQLTVTAVAGGASVFPPDGLVLGGSGAARSITLTPLEAATGTVAVTLTVIDGEGLRTTRSFQVTVNARPASVRDLTLATFAKGESDGVTEVNGFTFAQDADDPAVFGPLIGEE
jgi:hypothetical protein